MKTGHGGIRDIEFVIQFLQLLNGGALPEVRTGNTLDAIARLEQAGCLTPQERTDPRGQLQHPAEARASAADHVRPADAPAARRIATNWPSWPCGWVTPARRTVSAAGRRFTSTTPTAPRQNRKILDHLLHDAFSGDATIEPEVDLVNDPAPPPERIQQVLGRYPFEDVPAAYQNLMALATEKIRFLSTRRCRHFLAAIAPRLLAAIAATPEPDTTLVNLSRVSDSLGGKAALWELFSSNRPSLNLYVTLCAACPYLAGILTSNPGHDRRADGQPAGRAPADARDARSRRWPS